MKPFRISAAVTLASKKIEVIIEGPGVGPGGLRREFSSRTEAYDVVDAMNHGLRRDLERELKPTKQWRRGSVVSTGLK